jgi:hypothetical protein
MALERYLPDPLTIALLRKQRPNARVIARDRPPRGVNSTGYARHVCCVDEERWDGWVSGRNPVELLVDDWDPANDEYDVGEPWMHCCMVCKQKQVMEAHNRDNGT